MKGALVLCWMTCSSGTVRFAQLANWARKRDLAHDHFFTCGLTQMKIVSSPKRAVQYVRNHVPHHSLHAQHVPLINTGHGARFRLHSGSAHCQTQTGFVATAPAGRPSCLQTRTVTMTSQSPTDSTERPFYSCFFDCESLVSETMHGVISNHNCGGWEHFLCPL